MFRLVCIFLVFIILSAEANVPENENPVIRLSLMYDRKENYIVLKDKPLKIILENVYARHVWCADKYGKLGNSNTEVKTSATFEQFVPDTPFNTDSVNILYITNVTDAMSTRWGCVVLQALHGPPFYQYKDHNNYTAIQLHFNLHVKGARKVILIANNQSLTYVTTNLSVNYDGEANYIYEDSEDFSSEFSCKKAEDNNNQDTLRLEYYNAEGILLFQTKPRVTPHIFRSVLKSNNDMYYLDCIRAARNPEREYRYRTTFFKRDLHSDAVQHAVILSVNGQKLSTFLSNDTSYDDYIFRYIEGEVLNVTCQKMDVNMRGTLIFYFDAKIASQTLRSPSMGVISLNVSISDFKNKYLICSINNTELEKPNARLLFLSDVPYNDVRIRGLPRNNILYQYTNDEEQWTTEYQYSVNDTLNLTCVTFKDVFYDQSQISSYEKPFQWKFENQLMCNSTATMMPTSPPSYYSNTSFTKILDATHNGTKIKCIYYRKWAYFRKINKAAEIILRLKPALVSEAKSEEDTSGDNPNTIVYIAIGVGVAIVITMVCVVSWRKRTKRANLIENAYDNFSNQNDSPIPAFPSQWEANYNDSLYAKIDEEVMQENYNYSTDKLYGMTYKRQSNTSENHYTEIDDYFKPKPDGLAANWNTAQPSNYNNQTDTLKATTSHSLNNACYNNVSDSKSGTYDKLRHNNLPNNKGNENYSNLQKPSKCKSVTFRQMSNELRPRRNYSEGNTRQDGRINERKLNNDGYYANTGQDTRNIYMQPGDMPKKPNYENHFLHNEKFHNPLDSDYAEPYTAELGTSCKNDFYG